MKWISLFFVVLLTGCVTKTVDSTIATPTEKRVWHFWSQIPNSAIVVANNTGMTVRILQDGEVIRESLEQGQVCTIKITVYKSPWQTTLTVASRTGMANRTFDLYRAGEFSQHWQVQRFQLRGSY